MVVLIVNMEKFEFGQRPGFGGAIFAVLLGERYIESSEQGLHQF